MIKVESLSKKYGPFAAVEDVSFTARPGRVTGFLGPNGAGKSTTLLLDASAQHAGRTGREILTVAQRRSTT